MSPCSVSGTGERYVRTKWRLRTACFPRRPGADGSAPRHPAVILSPIFQARERRPPWLSSGNSRSLLVRETARHRGAPCMELGPRDVKLMARTPSALHSGAVSRMPFSGDVSSASQYGSNGRVFDLAASVWRLAARRETENEGSVADGRTVGTVWRDRDARNGGSLAEAMPAVGRLSWAAISRCPLAGQLSSPPLSETNSVLKPTRETAS
ncbi:hypothetical protein HPB51_021725 [Rhipicephalus microplus]|uniref:Uncharacterized protein n=1 Tax=Rhipicephalus microplus TaxID=6941 RepID=A0A9J6DQH1_RHIMP|nr:hypothetical protein HPB51_021725 [Rhipicephalus microplus]